MLKSGKMLYAINIVIIEWPISPKMQCIHVRYSSFGQAFLVLGVKAVQSLIAVYLSLRMFCTCLCAVM